MAVTRPAAPPSWGRSRLPRWLPWRLPSGQCSIEVRPLSAWLAAHTSDVALRVVVEVRAGDDRNHFSQLPGKVVADGRSLRKDPTVWRWRKPPWLLGPCLTAAPQSSHGRKDGDGGCRQWVGFCVHRHRCRLEASDGEIRAEGFACLPGFDERTGCDSRLDDQLTLERMTAEMHSPQLPRAWWALGRSPGETLPWHRRRESPLLLEAVAPRGACAE